MHKSIAPKYAVIEKIIGETPLQAVERLRKKISLSDDVPLAYAGRLDPMASGTLLVLIGDECKKQTTYHGLDKHYVCEVLLGASSDSGDVLGLVKNTGQVLITEKDLREGCGKIPQKISLLYPRFSSKTVQGKPLHTWTLEGKIDEIEIPTNTSRIYSFTCTGMRVVPKDEVVGTAITKIESIPKVTEPEKKLGEDFRRDKVRHAWKEFEQTGHAYYQIVSFECIASSGTYMRSVAEYLAEKLGTKGLAYSIHRKKIGKYFPITKKHGFWLKSY